MEIHGAESINNLLTGARQAKSALQSTNRQLENLLQHLASAVRTNPAPSDSASLGITEKHSSHIRGLKQASQSIADVSAVVDMANGAGREIAGLLQHQQNLAINAGNNTLTDSARQSLNDEYQSVVLEINRIASIILNNQQHSNNAGSNDGKAVNLPSIDFGSIGASLAATSIDTAANAYAAQQSIAQALSMLNSQLSALSAAMNQIASAGENISAAMANSQLSVSVINDENMATGLAEMTRQQILQEGAIRSFNKYNEITQSHILGLLE